MRELDLRKTAMPSDDDLDELRWMQRLFQTYFCTLTQLGLPIAEALDEHNFWLAALFMPHTQVCHSDCVAMISELTCARSSWLLAISALTFV